jgi:hypothetical protein
MRTARLAVSIAGGDDRTRAVRRGHEPNATTSAQPPPAERGVGRQRGATLPSCSPGTPGLRPRPTPVQPLNQIP